MKKLGSVGKLLLAREMHESLDDAQKVTQMLQELEKMQHGEKKQIVASRRKAMEEAITAVSIELEGAMTDAALIISRITNVREREICWQYYILGRTIEQISDTMSVTPRTVQRVKSETLNRLSAADEAAAWAKMSGSCHLDVRGGDSDTIQARH